MRIQDPLCIRPAPFAPKHAHALTAMPIHFEIQRIADAALRSADALLADWLPDGTRKGSRYWPTNPTRNDRKPGSFSINLHTGQWHDFASGDGGGDLVSLLAYLRGCRQVDAARIIAGQLGLPFGGDCSSRDMLAEAAERQRLARLRENRQRQVNAEREAKHGLAAARARHDYALAGPADPHHPYLVRKRVGPHHLRQVNNVLLVPICSHGQLVNLQRIDASGNKRFLHGGRLTGCYYSLGRIEPGVELYIAEGVATAITLHEHTGRPVAAAMSAGNLLPVGQELRQLYPEARLVIAGDDDRAKEVQGQPNTGKRAAIHAAAQLNCGYVLPAWPADAPLELSDFNDLHVWREALA